MSPPAVERVIGFDPGLLRTGYGVVERAGMRARLVEAGVLRIPSGLPLAERLARLYQDVREVLAEYQPVSAAVEELYSHYDRPQTAILMGHARGVILLAIGERKIPVTSYLPTQVKKTMTGNGHASKSQMQLAIQAEFALNAPPEPPDVADALAIALCHHHAMRLAS